MGINVLITGKFLEGSLTTSYKKAFEKINCIVSIFDDEAALKLAKDAKYKILGATSNAPIILANAEVLEDKRATGHPSIVSFLRAQKAEYTGQPIEVDEKIITAQDASFAETFGNAIIQTLQK